MTATQERSLADWLRLLRDGWFGLVAVAAAGVGLGVLANATEETQFGARGTLVVSSASGFLDPTDADKLPEVTATLARLSREPSVLRRASQLYVAAGRSSEARIAREQVADPEWIGDHVSVSQVASSSILEVNGRGNTQADATELTGAAAEALAETVNLSRPGVRESALESAGGIEVRVFTTAEPLGKVSPRTLRNIIIGANAGLILGIVAALALGLARRRIARGEDIAREMNTPLLGEVKFGRRGIAASDPGILQASARLLTMPSAAATPILLVVGLAKPRAIRAVAERLARSLAASSRVSVLVDGDLRRRDGPLTQDAVGLAGVLSGQADVVEMVDAVTKSASANGGFGTVSAGRPPDEPAMALRDPRLVESLEALREEFEFVVVAGPSSDRMAEIITLLRAVDEAVVVVGKGASARRLREFSRLGDLLRSRLIGTLVLK